MKSISINTFKDALHEKPEESIFIDVRSPGEYQFEHIDGVENVPLDQLSEHIDQLKKYKHVYVHCQSGNRSKKACTQLKQLGLENVINVEGGISAWEDAGFETEKKGTGIPIIRQVMITAGLLIILGYILSVFVSQSLIWISVIVGGGLFFAGVSGHCLMAKILEKMPWNKTSQ